MMHPLPMNVHSLRIISTFACHKTSWLVRHGPRPLVLGFPTSPSIQQHRRQHFQLMHRLVAQMTLVFPGLGWLREVKRQCAVSTLPECLPCSLARIPSSFLHRSAVLSCLGLPKFGCRRQSRHPAPAAPACRRAPVATPSTSSTSMSSCRRGSVAACRQHGLDAYFDGKTQRRCSAHPG